MDFRVGEEQRELAEGIRAMVAGRLPLEHLRAREGDARAISADDWAALGETGVFSLTLPEPVGTGLTMAEAVVVFEELGRALVPGPLVGTFLAARTGLVEGVAEGRARVGVHCAGPALGPAPGPVLVEHLGALDALLVFAATGGGMTRLLVPAPTAGATRMEAPLDPLTPLWRLDTLPAGAPVAADDDGSLFRDGALLTAALQVGHAAEALDLAVAYAKERQQFGTPIGTFQAIKHMCADMLLEVESARSAAYYAAWAAADDSDELPLVSSLAKAYCSEAYFKAAADNIQIHGGIGFTWEHDAHLYYRRAKSTEVMLGTPSEHREIAATHLIDQAAAAGGGE
jgi:alkylation response protein AidB-like acyl-CoA dehydrogenase